MVRNIKIPKWSKIFSVFLFLFLLGAYASTSALFDGNPYTPGSTLDPECAPTDTNCKVSAGPWLTSSSGIYHNGNVNVGSDTSSIGVSIEGVSSSTNIYEDDLAGIAPTSESDRFGNNVVAFYSMDDGSLNLFVCRDNLCEENDLYTVSTIEGGMGEMIAAPSLKIGSDDSIHISYITNDGLYYVRCSLLDCEDQDSTLLVSHSFGEESSEEVVMGYSLSLDEDNNPYIIYNTMSLGEGGSSSLLPLFNDDVSSMNIARYTGGSSSSCGDGDWACSQVTLTDSYMLGMMGVWGSAGNYMYIDEGDGYPRFIANKLDVVTEGEADPVYTMSLNYFKCNNSNCSTYTESTIYESDLSEIISSISPEGSGMEAFFLTLPKYLSVDRNGNPVILYNFFNTSSLEAMTFPLFQAKYVGGSSGDGCVSSDWTCINLFGEDGNFLMLKDFEIGLDNNLNILGSNYNLNGEAGEAVNVYTKCLNNNCSYFENVTISTINSPDFFYVFLGALSLSLDFLDRSYINHFDFENGTFTISKIIEIDGSSFSTSNNNSLYTGGDLGISGNLFVDGSIAGLSGIYLDDSVPSNRINALYNDDGDLYWNGEVLNQEYTPQWTDTYTYGGVTLTLPESSGIIVTTDGSVNYATTAGSISSDEIDNTGIGSFSLYSNTAGSQNTALGSYSLYSNTSGYYNLALGYNSGHYIANGTTENTNSDNSLYLGSHTKALADDDQNEIVIGYNTTGNGSNTTTIGTGNVLYIGGSGVTGMVARFTNSTGTCDINPTTSSVGCSSDIRLKKNITTLDKETDLTLNKENVDFVLRQDIEMPATTLDKILNLTPVTYNWNPEEDGSVKHIGFIAQEVEQIFPDLVATDDKTGLKSIFYTNLIPYTIEAIQEMNLIVKDLSSLDTTSATSLGSMVKNFLEDAMNGIDMVFFGEVHTKKLCLDDLCIDKEQLQQILDIAGVSGEKEGLDDIPVITDSNTSDNSNITTDTDDTNVDNSENSDQNTSNDLNTNSGDIPEGDNTDINNDINTDNGDSSVQNDENSDIINTIISS